MLRPSWRPADPWCLLLARENGFFDESGFYVRNKADKEEEKDAWLDSGEATLVSAEVRKRLAERTKAAQVTAVGCLLLLLLRPRPHRDFPLPAAATEPPAAPSGFRRPRTGPRR